MFEFHVTCNDNTSPACNAMDVYNRAGQIISDNLILTAKISVEINVQKATDAFFCASFPSRTYVDADKIRRYSPTALVKQLKPDFKPQGPDIYLTYNSNHDPNTFYPGKGNIQASQHDFLEMILHELQHGLGFDTTWYHLQGGSDLYPAFDYTTDDKGVITFQSFRENIFDSFLTIHPSGKSVEHTTPFVQGLNDMAGPSGKTYNNLDDFYNAIGKQQEQQGKSYTKLMTSMATSPFRMNFLANDGNNPIALETSYNPFKLGSITHFAKDKYKDTPDFLLISESAPGKTLDDKVALNGNYPGSGIGPDLRAMLATMGYKLRIPIYAGKAPTKITTTNSADNKLNSTVNNRNKKKRIIAL